MKIKASFGTLFIIFNIFGRIGFIIKKFKMPKHNAVFKMEQKNTMIR